MTSCIRVALATICLTSLLAASGCQEERPEIGQVTGVLTAKNKPLKGMAVTFLPDPAKGNKWPINASAVSDAQGKFELQYAYKGERGVGAPVGWHRVLVDDTRYSSIPQGAPIPPRLFSVDYGSPNSTPLSVEVKPGPQELNLDLK
jgi:hypothetical protein